MQAHQWARRILGYDEYGETIYFLRILWTGCETPDKRTSHRNEQVEEGVDNNDGLLFLVRSWSMTFIVMYAALLCAVIFVRRLLLEA